jgi:hypothetical protein
LKGGERAHSAGNDDHGVDVVAAGGDGSANVFVGDDLNFLWGTAENARREFFQIAGSDSEFFRKEPLAGFGSDEMNAGDARIVFKKGESLLGEDRAACARYANRNDGCFCRRHDFWRIHSVSQRPGGKSSQGGRGVVGARQRTVLSVC